MADKRSLVTADMLQFSEKLQSLRNFRSAFIDGSSNIRVSSVNEHAGTDMHSCAMHLLKKQHSLSVFEYMHLLLDVWVAPTVLVLLVHSIKALLFRVGHYSGHT